MLSDIEVQISDWDKSKFEETDSLPLMATPGPVVLILVTYWLFIFKIGPSYMKNKEPYKLETVLVIFNIFQIGLSGYIVKKTSTQLFRQGLTPKSCLINEETHRKEIISIIWLYFVTKIFELLDTIFFVLRKKDKQITFLHVYHHSLVMIGAWAYLKYWPSELLLFVIDLNSLVHVFMYAYYGLAALGPKATKYIFWKKHMTKMQLIQFVCILTHYALAIQRSECPPERAVAVFFAFNISFTLVLFVNFYLKSYSSGKKTIPFNNLCKLSEKES